MLKAFKRVYGLHGFSSISYYGTNQLLYKLIRNLHLQHSCLPSYVLYNMDIIYILYSALTAPHGERSSPVEKVALFVYIQI